MHDTTFDFIKKKDSKIPAVDLKKSHKDQKVKSLVTISSVMSNWHEDSHS